MILTFENVSLMLCGLALFFLGMNFMSEGLELFAGSRLTFVVEKLTKNKYIGAVLGMLITAIIQSSSATTVMAVGFVNAGIMTINQAVGIVMGANIGTTITGIIIAINLTSFAPAVIFVGVILFVFFKKEKLNFIGQAITGFGMIFLGIEMMSKAAQPLAYSESLKDLVNYLSNPVIGLLVGIAFTAVVQSSSVSVGVLQAFGLAGLVTLDNAIFVVYGQNIGTCVTALLASVGTTKAAKQTAVFHLLFNVFGAALFVVLTLLIPFDQIISHVVPDNIMAQISLVHVVFNVVSTAVFLPISDKLINLSYKIVNKGM